MVRPGLVLVSLAASCAAPTPAEPAPQPFEFAAEPKPPPRPAPPDWQPLPSVRECDVFYAVDPAAVAPALSWRPCAGGQPGCRELIDPTPPDPRFGAGVRVTLVAGVPAPGVHLIVYDERATPGRSRVSLGPLDGPPFVVFDHPGPTGPCRFGDHRFGLREAALILYRDVGEFDAESIHFAGPLHADPAWLVPTVRTPPIGEHDGAALRLVLEAGTGRLVPGPAALDRDESIIGAAIVRSDGRHLLTGVEGAPPRVLYTAPAGRHIASLHADGRAFYWAQARHDEAPGGKPEDIELWTANASDDPAGFRARKICDTELRQYPSLSASGDLHALAIGGGKLSYAVLGDPEQARIVVVDVATGAKRSWPVVFGEGMFATSVLFVSAEELGLHMAVDHQSAYWRVRLDALTPI